MDYRRRGEITRNIQGYFLEYLINNQNADLLDLLFKKYKVFDLKEKKENENSANRCSCFKENEHISKIIRIYFEQVHSGTYQDAINCFLKCKSSILLILYGNYSTYYLPKEVIGIIFEFSPSLNQLSVYIRNLLLEISKKIDPETKKNLKKIIWKEHKEFVENTRDYEEIKEKSVPKTKTKKECSIS